MTPTEFAEHMARPIVRRLNDDRPAAWPSFLADRDSGARVEIDEDMFYYWLEVLPPARMRYTATLADGTERPVSFGFAEGTERITAFWKEGGRYFCQLTTEVARGF